MRSSKEPFCAGRHAARSSGSIARLHKEDPRSKLQDPNPKTRQIRRPQVLIPTNLLCDLDLGAWTLGFIYNFITSGATSSPSGSARHVSPGAINIGVVSDPVLISSPALSGSAHGDRWIAAASSPRQSAGLRSTFVPPPSSTNVSFLNSFSLNSPSCAASDAAFALVTIVGAPRTSPAWNPNAATRSGGWNFHSGNGQSTI